MKHVTIAAAISALLAPAIASAEWQKTDTSLAWMQGSTVVWKFSFDPKHGKPHFHPLSMPGGPALTVARPEDHVWHYGLWFSWKYINGVNYWEEEGAKADEVEAKTTWKILSLETRPDGSATIQLALTYTHPSGRVDLTETRTIVVSAPNADGGYSIDWQGTFKAGPEGAVLDRTPMPNEPNGKVNGGYGGLGLRTAAEPLAISFISTKGGVTNFVNQRARPNAPAVAANLRDGEKAVGGIALFSDPANSGVDAPWYFVDNPEQQMRFLCAAVLAPQVIKLAPGAPMKLHYRIGVERKWTPQSLAAFARPAT